MSIQLGGLERHGGLTFGVDRYSEAVRAELLAMSSASIDRYLKWERAIELAQTSRNQRRLHTGRSAPLR